MINNCHKIGFNRNNARPRRIVLGILPDMPIYIREHLTTNDNKLFNELRDLKKLLNF